MRFRFNNVTYDVPADVDMVVTSGFISGEGFVADFDFVKDGEVVSMFGPEGKTWADVGIHRVDPTETCVSCGEPVVLGVEWCQGCDEDGMPCETDLRDSNNRVPV